jgi:tetratricopeptide (TPR) repeat protein
MIENSEQVISQTLQKLLKVVDGVATSGVQENQPDQLLPAMLIRRALEAVHLSICADKKIIKNQTPASAQEERAVEIGGHLDAVLRALENDDEEGMMPVNVRALLSLAGLYQSLGENTAALGILRRWLQRTDSRRDLLSRGQVQLQLGGILADMGNWISANQAIEESQAVLSTARDYTGTVSAQIVLGKIAYKQGNYPIAHECFEKALLLAEEYNDVRRIGITKMELGVIARMQGRANHALACFQDALIQFQSAHDSAGAAECLNHLGVLHLQKERWREAESCVDKAILFCRENGWPQVLAYGYLNKAAICLGAGDHALAARTWGKGLELMARLQNPPGLAKATRLCAQILIAASEIEAAQEVLKITAQLYQKYCIPLGLANCYLDLSRLLKEKDKKASADYETWSRAIFESLKLPADNHIAQKRTRGKKRDKLTKLVTFEET